jgi:hypothetical protein
VAQLWRTGSILFAQLASPDAPVRVDEEGIDGVAVGLVAEVSLKHHILETLGLLVKAPEDVAKWHLAATDVEDATKVDVTRLSVSSHSGDLPRVGSCPASEPERTSAAEREAAFAERCS